jgi:acyl-CoA thioesterase
VRVLSFADLAIDTAVTPLESGVYTGRLPEAWSFAAPSGGVLMTMALRAITAEIADPAFRPIAATALFCSVVPAGAMRTRVELLRRGNAVVQARAALSAEGASEIGLEVSATFGRDRRGPDFLDRAPPVVPGAGEAPLMVERHRIPGIRPRFFENFESRLALGDQHAEPVWTLAEARFAMWMRYRAPQRLADGTLDPLALPPIADTMPPAVVQKLGPDAPLVYAPSLDLTVHFLDPTPREWLLMSAHARRARAGYATAENEIWDDEGRLVAYATQTMMLREIRF